MRLEPEEKFRKIIESGGTASATFWRGRLQSLIEVYRYEGQVILTWEECPDRVQYDESRYTRDERHVFDGVEEVVAFLKEHAVPLAEFGGTIRRGKQKP